MFRSSTGLGRVAPPESLESQAEPTSPYPLPEEQSRAEPGGLLAWLHSAWDFIGRLFGSGRQTALAAALQQDDPPEAPEVIEYGYDAENRLVSVSAGEMAASFIYDGDGQRVASVIAGAATVYIGEVFEWEVATNSMRRYYYAGAQRVATRLENASPVWLLGDHLGSTSVAANTNGSLLSRQGYLPWGELRFSEGSLPGRYQFTGQASYEAEFGLYYYKARWYDPHLGRFSQPDSVVPRNQGIQAWDRYAYVNNSPVNAIDLSGHMMTECGRDGQDCNASTGEEYRDYVYNVFHNDEQRRVNADNVETVGKILGFIGSLAWEPLDWAFILEDGLQWYDYIGFFPVIPGAIGRIVGNSDDSIITLYRAVSKAELDDIISSGIFRPRPDGASMDGKWFSETLEGADEWGRQMYDDYSVVEVTLRRIIADEMFRVKKLDGIADARFAIDDVLDLFNNSILSIWSIR